MIEINDPGRNLSNDYIAHHGTKGMKWGVRKYQNADGSLNEAGKKRYAKKEIRANRKAKIHEGRAAYLEQYKGVASLAAAASSGSVAYFVASLAGASVPVAGAALGGAYVAGKMINSAMYDAAIKHQKKLANTKYSKAAEYRKLMNDE